MSTDRQVTLKRLLRAIALSVGDFALLLARCNSIEVRDRLVADLKAQLGSGLYDRHVTDADGVVNLVDILDEVEEGTQVISVTGLEASPHLHDILALANNAREEFRKRFKFPLVLWVTDDVDAQLRRRSPDLASWAAPPFDFALDRAELQAMLERETADVLDWAFAREGKRGIGQELQWAWQEWQRLEENRSPDLAAKVALAFGIEAGSGDAAREHFENCLAQVSTGSLAAAARYRLGLWWQLRGKQERVNFLVNCDRAREQLQRAWQEPEGKQASVALALGEILLALALPETGEATQWQVLADFANELVILPDWAAGLRAEVAIARQDWQVAKTEAEKALQGQERQGFYLLSLGRSLIGMNQAKEAIAPLEQAKALVLPEVDPDLHIRILQALHRAYTVVENYRDAFTVKCDRESVETSYGFRAFIGAGRLQPQRRVGAIGEDAMEEVAASGRQTDIEALVDRVKRSDCRLTVVHGPSGVGKSSLLQSGLVPALRKVIHNSRSVQALVIEHYEDWQGELASKLGRSPLAPLVKGGKEEDLEVPFYKGDLGGSESLIAQLHDRDRQNLITVLIFDQFEEFFFKHTDVPDRRKLYDFLRECLAVPYVWVILSLREDYIHYLLECDRLANIELINNDILNKNVRYYLGNFSKERAKAVIKELTERSPYRLEEALVDRLVADLAAEFGEVRPIELQVVGAQMLHGEAKITTLAAYEGLGKNPKRALVEGWLMQVVRDCGQENEELAQRVLYALTEEPEKRPVKTQSQLEKDIHLLSISEDSEDNGLNGDLDFVLKVPIGSGLAFKIPTKPEDCYQLIHDYLVPPIRQQFGVKLTQQLEEEKRKRKLAEQERDELQKQKLLETEQKNQALRQALAIAKERDELQKQKIIEIEEKNAEIEERNQEIQKQNVEIKEKNTVIEERSQEIQKQNVEIKEKNAEIEERSQEIQKQNKKLVLISVIAAFSGFIATVFYGSAEVAKQNAEVAKQNAEVAKQNAEVAKQNAEVMSYSLDLQKKMDDELFTLEEQIIAVDKVQNWKKVILDADNKILLMATLNRAAYIAREKNRFEGHKGAIESIAVARDGKTFVSGSEDKTAKLWKIDKNEHDTFNGHEGGVKIVAFSSDDKAFITGSADKTAKLWRVNSPEKPWKDFKGNGDIVTSVAIMPDNKKVLIGSWEEKFKLKWHNIDDSKISADFDTVKSLAVPKVGNLFITGSFDKIALRSIDNSDKPLAIYSNPNSNPRVTSIAISDDGKEFVTGSEDRTAKLWNINNVNNEYQLKLKLTKPLQHKNKVTTVAFTNDGQKVLTGSKDEREINSWNRIDGQLLETVSFPNYVSSIAFSPDGKYILIGSINNTIKLFSFARSPEKSPKNLNNTSIDNSITFPSAENTADGDQISSNSLKPISSNNDQTKKLNPLEDNKTWELLGRDGKKIYTFRDSEKEKGHDDQILTVVFSPDGKSVLTGSKDRTAKLWINENVQQTFQGHKDSVLSVAFSPDGKYILTGSADGTIKLWSIDNKNNTNKLLYTFQSHMDKVVSVAFDVDAQNNVKGIKAKAESAKSEQAARYWNLDLDHSLSAMCDHLHDFASLSNDRNILEEDRKLRKRAKTACEGIPPPS
jgi:WD40 repeat protein